MANRDAALIQPVDLSPITFTQFVAQDQRKLVLTHPLTFTPTLDEEGGPFYVICDESINVHVYAMTREALIFDLEDQFFFLWDTYGSDQLDPNMLTEGALACRNALRKQFKEI